MTVSPNPPEIKSAGDTFFLKWQKEGIEATISRIQDKNDTISAELLLTKGGGHIYQARVNLLSPTAKNSLVKELNTRITSLDWRVLIEQAFVKTLELYRQGEPVIQVGNLPQRESVKFRLKPLLLEKELNCVYAYGGMGKSVLSDFIALLVQCNQQLCGFMPQQGNVLILDWETDEAIVDERIKAIKYGMKIESTAMPYYRKCFHILRDDIHEIQAEVLSKDIKLVIVDSANMASGMSSDWHGSALTMISALRSLNTTVLMIDHKPKGNEDEGGSIFGSIIKTNAVRNAWELKGSQDDGSNLLSLGLFHRKHNNTIKFKPIGFEIEFVGDDDFTNEIFLKRVEVADIPELSGSLSLGERILHILKSGSMSVSEIVEELGEKENSVKITLTRLKKKQLIVNLMKDNTWGLMQR